MDSKHYKYFAENVSGHFEISITDLCTETANEFENRNRDNGYTQEKVGKNRIIKICE